MPTPGHYKKSKVQWADEGTPGTEDTTATAMWRGPAGHWKNANTQEDVLENIGLLINTDRVNIPMKLATLELPDTELTFEQFQYLLAYGLGGPITGTADGTGSSGYKYINTIPAATNPTDRALTIQTGDDKEVRYAVYCKPTKISVSGASRQAVKMKSSWVGRERLRLGTAFTPNNLTAVETNIANFGKSKLFLDDVGGTIGTTNVASQFLGFTLDIDLLWELKYTGDDSLTYAFPSFVGIDINGTLTFEHDTQVVGTGGEIALGEAKTPRLMRVDLYGPSYGTAGTSTVFTGGKSGVRFDLPIIYTPMPEITQQNNNSIIVASFSNRYNGTFGSAGTITVCNELTALP